MIFQPIEIFREVSLGPLGLSCHKKKSSEIWITSYRTEYIPEGRTAVRTLYLALEYQTQLATNIWLVQGTHFHPASASSSSTPSKHRTTSSCNFTFFCPFDDAIRACLVCSLSLTPNSSNAILFPTGDPFYSPQ